MRIYEAPKAEVAYFVTEEVFFLSTETKEVSDNDEI